MVDNEKNVNGGGGDADALPPIDVSGLTALFGTSDERAAVGGDGAASDPEPDTVLFAHADDSGVDGDEGEVEEYPLAAITEDLDLAEAFRAGDEVDFDEPSLDGDDGELDLAEAFLAHEESELSDEADLTSPYEELVTAAAVSGAPPRSLDLAFDQQPAHGPAAQTLAWDAGAPVPAPASEQGLPRRKRFTRRQQIIAGIGVAVVALIIAGLALIFALAGRAPAIDEQSLQTLRNEEQALTTQVAALEADLAAFTLAQQEARTEAETFADPLARMTAISDEALRAAAETARVAFIAELDALEAPEPVELTESDAAAPTTQEEIDAALAAVRAQSGLVAQAQQALEVTTDRLDAARDSFRNAVDAFTASLPAFAATLVAGAPDAEEGFRVAVTDAAATVAAGDTFGPDGLLPWNGYEVAIAALTVDQQRALDEAAREAEEQRPVTPSTPRPTTPAPPTSPPVDPEPTDPPVDPGTTDPPTDPGTGDPGTGETGGE